MTRIELDPDACEGTGLCAMVAPHLFDTDRAPPASVKTGEVRAGDEQAAREAERMCPVRAIRLTG